MDDANKTMSLITSAAAFVEGGIQEAIEDACSICLEAFCTSDPSTITSCKHEFHLQCILEWCQRSSNCPMCWQSVSLKDPDSQELLEAVGRERNIRSNPARNSTIFRHPTLGDFELQHLPAGANDTELEDRILQHLAAAAAMRRAHVARRDGSRSRPSAHVRPQFLVFSTHPNSPAAGHISNSRTPVGGEPEPASITVASPSVPLAVGGREVNQHIPQFPSSAQTGQISASAPGSIIMPTNPQGISINNRTLASQFSMPNPDRAGPSDFQSLSESWRSRFNAMSMRYKESISRSTRGWKEKLFSRSTSVAEIGSEVRREINAGITNVSRMMEPLETREYDRSGCVSISNNLSEPSIMEGNHNIVETRQEPPLNDNNNATFAASSVSH